MPPYRQMGHPSGLPLDGSDRERGVALDLRLPCGRPCAARVLGGGPYVSLCLSALDLSGYVRDIEEGGAVSDPKPTHQIVAGVDGSSCSLDALEWAIRQAQLTGASVLVVTAWQRPAAVGWGLPLAPSPSPPEDANSVLEEVLDPIRKRHATVDIQEETVQGHPAPALVEASRGADLLVVGSHGRGAFAGMLLGSVSRHCVSHAHCPVLVVRGAS